MIDKSSLLELMRNGALGMIGGMTRYIFMILTGKKEFNFGRMVGMSFISITIAVAVGDMLPSTRFEHGRDGVMVFVGIVSFELMKEIIDRVPKEVATRLGRK